MEIEVKKGNIIRVKELLTLAQQAYEKAKTVLDKRI